MTSVPRDPPFAPLPTSRLHRLFRPFLSKLNSLQTLLPPVTPPSPLTTESPTTTDGPRSNTCTTNPHHSGFQSPHPAPHPKLARRTYSRHANNNPPSTAPSSFLDSTFASTSASSAASTRQNQFETTSGSARGLPLFELDRKMKRTRARGLPAELGRIPLPTTSAARIGRGIDSNRGEIKCVGVELVELSYVESSIMGLL